MLLFTAARPRKAFRGMRNSSICCSVVCCTLLHSRSSAGARKVALATRFDVGLARASISINIQHVLISLERERGSPRRSRANEAFAHAFPQPARIVLVLLCFSSATWSAVSRFRLWGRLFAISSRELLLSSPDPSGGILHTETL